MLLLSALALAGSQAQTTYDVEFFNGSGCDLKLIVHVDNSSICSNPYVLLSLTLVNGTTNTFSYTVPDGNTLCYYEVHDAAANPVNVVHQIPLVNCGGYYYSEPPDPICNGGLDWYVEASDCTSIRIDIL